jgi:hypothetical protein
MQLDSSSFEVRVKKKREEVRSRNFQIESGIELAYIVHYLLTSSILLSYLLHPGVCKDCWSMSSKFMATLLPTFMKMVSLSLSLSHTHVDTHTNFLGSCSMRIFLVSCFFFFLFLSGLKRMLSNKKVYFMSEKFLTFEKFKRQKNF